MSEAPFLMASSRYLVDEAHDRRVLDVVPAEGFRVRVLIAGGDFEVLEIEIIVGQARHDRVGLLDGLVDRRLQLVVLDHDELDAHRGLEANLIERVQIGRIRDRQEQPLAALHQGQYPVLLQELVAHRAHRVHVRRHGVQIEQRHAEFVRRGDGDIARARQARRHEVGHQALTPLLRLGNGILHGGLIQQAVLDEPLGETAEEPWRLVLPAVAIALSFMDLRLNPRSQLSLLLVALGQLSNQSRMVAHCRRAARDTDRKFGRVWALGIPGIQKKKPLPREGLRELNLNNQLVTCTAWARTWKERCRRSQEPYQPAPERKRRAVAAVVEEQAQSMLPELLPTATPSAV